MSNNISFNMNLWGTLTQHSVAFLCNFSSTTHPFKFRGDDWCLCIHHTLFQPQNRTHQTRPVFVWCTSPTSYLKRRGRAPRRRRHRWACTAYPNTPTVACSKQQLPRSVLLSYNIIHIIISNQCHVRGVGRMKFVR